jgi:hypothetical protein
MSLNATTITAAIGTNDTSLVVASATGITAPIFNTGAGITYLFLEQEWMLVTGITGTVVSVQRGVLGSCAVAHLSGTIVLAGLPSDFPSPIPISVKSQQDFYPNVVGFSASVTMANTMTASGFFFHTTGTTILKTLNAPASGPAGGSFPMDGSQVSIVFDGSGAGLTWDATGNINVAGTATTAGSMVTFTYDQSITKWIPSRLA